MEITLLQLNYTVGDIEGNSELILKSIQNTRNHNKLFITSELALTGYPPKDLLLNQNFIKKALQKLEYIANHLDKNTKLLVGTPFPNSSGIGKSLYNSAVFIEGNKIVHVFKKTLLPTYDVFDESRYFESAKNSEYFESEGLKIGVTVCEDIWNEKDFWKGKRWLYKDNPLIDLNFQSIDLIVNLSASPFTLGKHRVREAMFAQIALKYNTPIIYANQIGGNDDLVFDGRSCVVGRDGKIKARAKSFSEDTLNFTVPELKGKSEPVSKTVEEETFQALVLGTKDYLKKCDFKKAVIGLSGGIDSSLTAVIAVKALGNNNVTGIIMPSPYTSKYSVEDALKLAKNLEIKINIIPIENLMKEYGKSLTSIFDSLPNDVTEENIQARIRGSLLMAYSNKFRSLVLSTGNKSELAVGYTTLYGDLAGGLDILGDVPKTMVYRTARWLNSKEDTIPETIIDKPPSAELKPNQTDQDILPPYEILDEILRRIIELHQSENDMTELGIDKKTVRKVFQMVKNAEFKRKQAPLTIKITDRAFGSGWRMPIASKNDL